ncbi:hydrogenase expression/formation protein HypE [Gilliamella sp. wkB178]|uniref:hydrogenase expression/formation protein HypE n=1 Tax=Gilliamella sp. wkB178 TaxID=3120259 RepID=UPI00080DC525|nr:hydrogenase expression/formation protein HypE [Gilliamella apicola]OCG06515.1 hydrogenase expression/formation protein HypE [Gilliamella apicola]
MTIKTISLMHGSGGLATQQLIDNIFMQAFNNEKLTQREDQARLLLSDFTQIGNKLAFSTDSYVIDPLIFPGGDIGKLAVCGTVNDLAVSGAYPRYLSCGFIIEEGLPIELLTQVVSSMANTAKIANIEIVTGDTKVVPKGAADKLFINTSGIGVIPYNLDWGMHNIYPGDSIIVSGTLGDHGATILNEREKFGLMGNLSSDCAPLNQLIDQLRTIDGIHALRDATRGGVNAVLHEFSQACGYGMKIQEADLPLSPMVRGICELLGLDALNFANEGKLVIIASATATPIVLETLRAHPLGTHANRIGLVTPQQQILLCGLYGVERLLDLPSQEPLPRIC